MFKNFWSNYTEVCNAQIRIQIKRAKGCRIPQNTVCVTRPSKWSNPFKFEEDWSREQAVAEHKTYINKKIASGELNIGDVRCSFRSTTTAAEEYELVADEKRYKLQEITIVRGLSNDAILYVKGFGKRVSGR